MKPLRPTTTRRTRSPQSVGFYSLLLLPKNGSEAHVAKVPPATDEAGRKAWLRERWVRRQGGEANRFRDVLIKGYGPEKGAAVKFAEAFEICEYGRKPKPEEIKVLFPFFP